MSVPTRYIFAALAVCLSPGAAHAGGCCRATPGVVAPPPSVPAPSIGAGHPSPGQRGRPCASPCVPGLPAPPMVTITPPYVAPPHVVVVNRGIEFGDTSIYNSSLIVEGDVTVRSAFLAGGGGIGVQGAIAVGPTYEMASETRIVTRMATVEAYCIDDRGIPHPASQTFAERAPPPEFEGEIFRCIAGTALRATVAAAEGERFEDGRNIACAKGEALVYQGGQLACHPQEARRPCNERSLLRRHGPGVKVVQLRETETIQVRREVRTETLSAGALFDGGVGQSVW